LELAFNSQQLALGIVCAWAAVLKVPGAFSNAMQIAYTQCVMRVAVCKLSIEQHSLCFIYALKTR